jgi:hypothetical protein
MSNTILTFAEGMVLAIAFVIGLVVLFLATYFLVGGR